MPCLFVVSAAHEPPSRRAQSGTAQADYSPLDSLYDGLDIALKALKMNRDDLTFRGDYIQEDPYRLELVNELMGEPLELLAYADHRLKEVCRSELLSWDMFTGFPDSPYRGLENEPPQIQSIKEQFLAWTTKRRSGRELVALVEMLLQVAGAADPGNAPELLPYSPSELDSLAEGFTLLLEEKQEDEFLSVDEIDSIQQYEDVWASRMRTLAKSCIGRERLIQGFGSLMHKLGEMRPDIGTRLASAYSVATSYGHIVIGDTTDNDYSGELFMVIDPGGDDTYNIQFEGTGHQTYIIDYSGNDTYDMPKNRVSPYFFGAHVIVDFGGDDVYNAGSWTLGAGLFGVGILWDRGGNDRYFGDTFSQGAGCFGVGILRDDEGNDSYQAALFSQGFGFVDGIGVLIDNSGNDIYFAGGKYKDILRYSDHYLSLSQGFAYGIRPKMSGGVGMLIDGSGNDVYVSDIFGQGASYWYGLGLLADAAGNDQYISFQYAQGSATHMTLGILYDASGDDVYSAKGVSQGCGHDRATGFLVDLDGNDNYNAYDLSQGAGSANGLGVLADIRGNDAYIVRSDKNTQGYGNPRREYGSVGIFLDLAGKDGYSGGRGADSTWWSYSKWGIGIDR